MSNIPDPNAVSHPVLASRVRKILVLYLDCGHVQCEPVIGAGGAVESTVWCHSGDGRREITGYERRDAWIPGQGERYHEPS